MINQEYLDQTGLHALGLLTGEDRSRYLEELRVNPHLRAALRETQEELAAVSLTARQYPPPASVLAKVEQRIGSPRLGITVSGWHPRRPWPGWMAAAALAVAASWFGFSAHQAERRLGELQRGVAAGQTEQERTRGQAGTTGPDEKGIAGANEGVAAGFKDRPANFGGGASQSWRLRNIHLPGVAADQVRLRAGTGTEPQTPQGVADLRIMEMHPPGVENASRSDRTLLAAKVAEAVAASGNNSASPAIPAGEAEKTPPPSPVAPEPTRLRGQGGAPSSDIVIEGGGTVNLDSLNLHPDAQVLHRNFPADEEFSQYGLTRLDTDRVWDGNGGLWYRQADGRTYVGQKAPDGFQPPDPDDPGAVPSTSLRPSPSLELNAEVAPGPVSGIPASSEILPQAYAMPVMASDGQGMIVTQNLPEPAGGQGYALWSNCSDGTPPVLLGFLPGEGGSNGVFAFELPKGAPLPAGYLITLQPLDHHQSPGSSILQGP